MTKFKAQAIKYTPEMEIDVKTRKTSRKKRKEKEALRDTRERLLKNR